MSINSTDLVHFFHSQINAVRTNPQSLMPALQSRKFINEHQFVHAAMPNVHYRTSEGAPAVQEAIAFLEHAQPVPQLLLSEYMCQAAYQVGLNISKVPVVTNVEDHMRQAGKELEKLGVQATDTQIMVEYGFREDTEIIPSLLVDDGDKDRTNRHLLLDPRMKYLGISVHEHEEYDYVLVILLNGHIEAKEGCKCAIF